MLYLVLPEVNVIQQLAKRDAVCLRDNLIASYNKIGQTVTFQDPLGTSIQVHFDSYVEHALDLHAQQVALATGGTLTNSYFVAIELVEA